MSLLKKLAGLVVEFPEEDAPDSAEKPSAGGDALAAIEQIRADLERGSVPDFDEDAAKVETPKAGSTQPQKFTVNIGNTPEPAPSGEAISIPGVLSVPEVYAKAGIKDEQDFDIFKVEKMMVDPEISDLEVAMRARMVKLTLKNMGKDLKDILADAGRRDQALETYLAFLERKVADTEVKVATSNASIQQQIDEFVATHRAMIQANDSQLALARQSLEQYKLVKASEEQRLFDISAPFVGNEANPVDIG